MKREFAEQIVNQYLSRIYSFVRQRVSNEEDVADVAQEISLNIYKSLCVKEVNSIDGFVWTVARNILINYYRGKQKSYFNVSIDSEQMEFSDGKKTPLEQMIDKENYEKIRSEIAYLSKTQRKILIMYYYEEKKQSEIAEILRIPLGTVKWHLNVAKGELKKGMEKMRDIKDLRFNPVEFSQIGLCGGTGEMGSANNFMRSALSQNILYCIRKNAMTIEEVADTLGVSPVYVESEIEFLEEYQIVIKQKSGYISNIVVEESDGEIIRRQKQLYKTVAPMIANELFDKIMEGGYLNSDEILGPKDDKNFIMWSLMFYLLAVVESDSFKEEITFDGAATVRADGGTNIITATVKSEEVSDYFKMMMMDKLCGPCWNGNDELALWLIDGPWTEKRVGQHYGGANIVRDLKLLERFYKGEELSVDEYTFLLDKHYIKKKEDGFDWAIVVLKDGETKNKLFELTKQIKNKVLEQVEDQLEEYKRYVLESDPMPNHIRIQQKYMMQFLFHSDGWFMLYAKDALVESGKLKLVEGEQRYSVTEMLFVR